jgi:conjugal transfer pilus assembly protein TraU
MFTILKTLFLACLILGGATAAEAQTTLNPACRGKLFIPYTDMDWNLLFPISIVGVKLPDNTMFSAPLMFEPPVCVCPGVLGVPVPGLGFTFWEPLHVIEIQRTPGCLSTINGVQVLQQYSSLHGEHAATGTTSAGTTTRMQGHVYTYPVFGLIEALTAFVCKAPTGFALIGMTEIDATWQDDTWSAVFAPEGALFANLLAQASCAIDAISSNLGFPMDPLFWCAGSFGPVFPLSGNSQPGNGPYLTNGQIVTKLMAKLHRFGLMWQTIGPTAMCFSHPNPLMLKSQYRLNQIGPIPRRGVFPPPVIGSAGLTLLPPVSNLPGLESTDYLMWQGKQCCVRP